jgi:hypothetical protein
MISDAVQDRLEKGERAENKLDKIKREGREMADKMAEIGGAAGGGLLYGVINRRQGGNLDVPWQIAGKVSLDTALAIGGGVAILAGKDRGGILGGAAAAWIGLATARYGDAYEANSLTAAGTATTPLMQSNQAGQTNTQLASASAPAPATSGAPMLHGRSYVPGYRANASAYAAPYQGHARGAVRY